MTGTGGGASDEERAQTLREAVLAGHGAGRQLGVRRTGDRAASARRCSRWKAVGTMPKLVDHAERRQRIIDAAWHLIADRGLEAATMREIAREAGYANGALTHYFADKEALLRAVYEHVYAATNDRAAEAVAGLRGVDALRAFCRQVLPLGELTVEEARAVLAVWGRLPVDGDLAVLHAESLRAWGTWIRGWLAEGRLLGQVSTASADDVLAHQLLGQLMGAQVMVLAGDVGAPATLEAALEDWISRLHRS